jgi:hypothetical protein
MKHGTLTGYTTHACRCEECRAAMRAYHVRRGAGPLEVDRDLICDLLHELFPDGLTDDCPARRAKATA